MVLLCVWTSYWSFLKLETLRIVLLKDLPNKSEWNEKYYTLFTVNVPCFEPLLTTTSTSTGTKTHLEQTESSRVPQLILMDKHEKPSIRQSVIPYYLRHRPNNRQTNRSVCGSLPNFIGVIDKNTYYFRITNSIFFLLGVFH